MKQGPSPAFSSSRSAVELTVKVAAWAGSAVSSRHATMSAASNKPDASAPKWLVLAIFLALFPNAGLSSRPALAADATAVARWLAGASPILRILVLLGRCLPLRTSENTPSSTSFGE